MTFSGRARIGEEWVSIYAPIIKPEPKNKPKPIKKKTIHEARWDHALFLYDLLKDGIITEDFYKYVMTNIRNKKGIVPLHHHTSTLKGGG